MPAASNRGGSISSSGSTGHFALDASKKAKLGELPPIADEVETVNSGESPQANVDHVFPMGQVLSIPIPTNAMGHVISDTHVYIHDGHEIEDYRHKTRRGKHSVFVDPEDIRQGMIQHMTDADYDVAEFYWDHGRCQAIARDTYFDNLGLFVIALNAVWMAYDVDHNKASLSVDSDPIFILADNLFCIWFTLEWAIRFGAFKEKKHCVKDYWFVFDSIMCALFVLETWMLTLGILMFGGGRGSNEGSFGNATILKVFSVLKIARMARMVRILRSIPELMVVIKGMTVAIRAVSATLMLLFFIVYVFAIGLKQLLAGTSAGEKIFPDVAISARFLLLATMCPDLIDFVNTVWDEGIFFALVFMTFVLIGAVTIMNMLIGILVGVMNTVASVEKESMLVDFAKATILKILRGTYGNRVSQRKVIDADFDGCVSKAEFDALIQLPEACTAFLSMGVDPLGLQDYADFIFADHEKLTFENSWRW